MTKSPSKYMDKGMFREIYMEHTFDPNESALPLWSPYFEVQRRATKIVPKGAELQGVDDLRWKREGQVKA